MGLFKSLNDSSYTIIATLLHDVQKTHDSVFSTKAYRLDLKKIKSRLDCEGMSFLTKALPRLGKALDKALALIQPLNSTELGFKPQPGSKLPKLFGELFNRVLNQDGFPLSEPCVQCVRDLRLLLFVFYKYELPYTSDQEHEVVNSFVAVDDHLSSYRLYFQGMEGRLETCCPSRFRDCHASDQKLNDQVARIAQQFLDELFANFDPLDIHPRHGPGAVATRQSLWTKYQWTNISDNITKMYPIDAFYYASLGHFCDEVDGLSAITNEDLPARVILVPKDSRGPRLISCEPVDYQWIQQGLGRAIVQMVEKHRLTRDNVFFTDQVPNQIGALLGSKNGRYATLDLKEASDRVSLDLVRLLFPKRIVPYLEACRSSSTMLPDGRVITLNKFAPMGSCLCFPVLALTVWAILTAGAPDVYTRERIHVYGDDVIVPTAYAENAIEHLESFGLKVNHDKSCTKGFFRESCGTDAFKGVNVTPVRLRTVWSSRASPDVYTSWIAYANSFYDRHCYGTYDLIVSWLYSVYGDIPDESIPGLGCPRLRVAADYMRPPRHRTSKRYQKRLYRVREVRSRPVYKTIKGWSMLLRFFSESGKDSPLQSRDSRNSDHPELFLDAPFSVRRYTPRRTSMLVWAWR